MKNSTKNILIGSVYLASLSLFSLSGYELYKKEYFPAGIVFLFSLPILTAGYCGPKVGELEDEADRLLESKALEERAKEEELNKAA